MTSVRPVVRSSDGTAIALPVRARRWYLGPIALQVTVFVLAVGARLAVILRHGTLHGNYGYDSGVYFAAGDALLHGRFPYRDFILIHPPVVALVLAPFAALTRVVSDEAAFTTTILAFTVLGGINAVLVLRVVRRMGLGLRCAAVAGLFYALWFGSIGSEYLIKLEPLGNLLFLLGLLAALRAVAQRSPGWTVLAGAAAGASVSVKIWWIVPVVALIVWMGWRTRSRRATGQLLAGAVGVSLLIDGPFFVISPRAMWSSVVLDQVSRQSSSLSPLSRLTGLSTVTRVTGHLHHRGEAVVSLVLLVVVWWVVRRAWLVPSARPVVLLFAVQGVVLLVSPSWFAYYADFIAVSAAIVVGAAARPVVRACRYPIPGAGWTVTVVAAALTVSGLVVGRVGVAPFHGAAVLARGAGTVRCVMTDSPMAQIELDALSRSFADGCPNWVDVTGRTYGADRSSQPRTRNPRWQRDAAAYLRSGGAVIIIRAHNTGLTAATYRVIHRDGVLSSAGGYTLYRVRH